MSHDGTNRVYLPSMLTYVWAIEMTPPKTAPDLPLRDTKLGNARQAENNELTEDVVLRTGIRMHACVYAYRLARRSAHT